MSRNANSHFSVNPTNLDIGRSRWETPFNHTSAGNFGDLIPFFWTEILPGDTLSIKTSKVLRILTMLDPVFGNAFCDIYYFFVPMRLVWQHTREFFGENTAGPWAPSTSYSIPKIQTTTASANTVVKPGSVADFLGVPCNVTGLEFSALPFRSYAKVYNDWFMSEVVQSPPVLNVGDGTQSYLISSPERGGYPYKACKYHDYFTSATPTAQRGPAVTIPLSGTVPITTSGGTGPVVAGSSGHLTGGSVYLYSQSNGGYLGIGGTINHVGEVIIADDTVSNYQAVNATNLEAQWPSSGTLNLNGALPITVNDLRMAFQTQKWYEKSALFGKIA